MQAFSRFTMFSSFLSFLVFFDVSSGLFIRRSDTTNPAQLVLWDPKTGVQYHDIAQGTSDDCWLDASMASIAYADPNHIEKIMVNDGAQAEVTLWDGSKSNTYTVQKRTIDDMKKSFSDAAPAVTGGQWIWPACMEDAFMELAQDSSTGIVSHHVPYSPYINCFIRCVARPIAERSGHPSNACAFSCTLRGAMTDSSFFLSLFFWVSYTSNADFRSVKE